MKKYEICMYDVTNLPHTQTHKESTPNVPKYPISKSGVPLPVPISVSTFPGNLADSSSQLQWGKKASVDLCFINTLNFTYYSNQHL